VSTDQKTSDSHRFEQARAQLLDARATWNHRLEAIQDDRRRSKVPLDPDFADQASERQNDETLDALDQHGRDELAAIEAALDRLEAGTYGRCVHCGDPIGEKRLYAMPAAIACLSCANRGPA